MFRIMNRDFISAGPNKGRSLLSPAGAETFGGVTARVWGQSRGGSGERRGTDASP